MSRLFLALLRIVVTLAATAYLTGCANTLYFMEGTKAALAVEVSGTSPEPVALTAGYKRTVATIVPPRDDAASNSDNGRGEALSVVSRFQLSYDDQGDVALENIFVTGRAAQAIGSSVEATNALIVSSTFSHDSTQEVISCWLDNDSDGSREADFRQWAETNGRGLSKTSIQYGSDFRALRTAAIEDLGIDCAGDDQ